MQPITYKIHLLLLKNKKTIAVAESCTGGLLSKLLTDLPGSSRYFKIGVVAYSNKAKEAILKIPKLTLKTHGAVSRETALLMAKSVRKLAKSDFGIGITGIAGPGGATLKKLLGTVFIAICHNDQAICKEFRFSGRRTKIREKSAVKALELLGKSLRH